MHKYKHVYLYVRYAKVYTYVCMNVSGTMCHAHHVLLLIGALTGSLKLFGLTIKTNEIHMYVHMYVCIRIHFQNQSNKNKEKIMFCISLFKAYLLHNMPPRVLPWIKYLVFAVNLSHKLNVSYMYVCKDSTCICKHALNRDAFF